MSTKQLLPLPTCWWCPSSGGLCRPAVCAGAPQTPPAWPGTPSTPSGLVRPDPSGVPRTPPASAPTPAASPAARRSPAGTEQKKRRRWGDYHHRFCHYHNDDHHRHQPYQQGPLLHHIADKNKKRNRPEIMSRCSAETEYNFFLELRDGHSGNHTVHLQATLIIALLYWSCRAALQKLSSLFFFFLPLKHITFLLSIRQCFYWYWLAFTMTRKSFNLK